MRQRKAIFTVVVLVAVGLGGRRAGAATIQAGPGQDLEAIINGLAPGDELVLADGMYVLDSSRFGIEIAGTEAEPIVIRAAEGARPHFHRPNASQNLWDLRVAYVVLRGIEFSGGSAGLRFESGRFVTIEDCELHDTDDVALRMNDAGQVYEGMRILRNEIHHTSGTGEGMYLGCNSNGCQLANALIEGNYVHHTNQSTVSQGDGIEIKEGSFGNVVRDNVIHDTNYPCILTYGTVGNGAPNIIERNAMWNCGDHGIQSAADAVIRNNIILGAAADGIAMQPHQAAAPSNLVVVHNTILNTGRAISLRGATGAVVIANNALYSESAEALFTNGDTSMLASAGNVGQGGGMGVTAGSVAADLTMASFAGAPPMNVFPTAAGALAGAGEVAQVASDDFDGVARMGVADVGAYALASGGPRWPLSAGFKNVDPGPSPGADAGVGGDGGAGMGDDAGMGGSGEGEGGGCGCRAASAAPSWWLLVLGGVAVAPRSRRRRGARGRP